MQEGGGEAWGLTTGAKALFCFTAEMTLAGENEKMPCVLLQFEERLTEEAAIVGLDGTTGMDKAKKYIVTTQRGVHVTHGIRRCMYVKKDLDLFIVIVFSFFFFRVV